MENSYELGIRKQTKHIQEALNLQKFEIVKINLVLPIY